MGSESADKEDPLYCLRKRIRTRKESAPALRSWWFALFCAHSNLSHSCPSALPRSGPSAWCFPGARPLQSWLQRETAPPRPLQGTASFSPPPLPDCLRGCFKSLSLLCFATALAEAEQLQLLLGHPLRAGLRPHPEARVAETNLRGETGPGGGEQLWVHF